MKLETHEGTFADPATIDDIALAVVGLTEVGEAFVVLSDDSYGTYVQAAGTVGEAFIVERRDGGAGDHYRADHRVSADDLVVVLTAYLLRTPGWRDALTWHRVRVDQDPPTA